MGWFKDLQDGIFEAGGGIVGGAGGMLMSPVIIAGELSEGKSLKDAIGTAGEVIQEGAEEAAKYSRENPEKVIKGVFDTVKAVNKAKDFHKKHPF